MSKWEWHKVLQNNGNINVVEAYLGSRIHLSYTLNNVYECLSVFERAQVFLFLLLTLSFIIMKIKTIKRKGGSLIGKSFHRFLCFWDFAEVEVGK